MKTFSQIYIGLFILFGSFSSCRKDPIIIDAYKPMKDLVVPAGFNCDMIKSVGISIQLPSTVNYDNCGRIVQIWDENINGKPGQVIKTGSAGHDGLYQATISVPTITTKIFISCFAGWRMINLKQPGSLLINGVFTVDYNAGCGKVSPKAEPGLPVAVHPVVRTNPVLLKSNLYNDIINGDFSANEIGKMDTWSSPFESDSLWYATDESKDHASIESEEGNSFARLNSGSYSSGGFTQEVKATEGQVVTFSGDARGFDSQQDIYLFLIPRNKNGFYLDFFSYNIVNPGNMWANGAVVGTMPPGTVACQILFYKRSTGIVDFDNAVVHVENFSDLDHDGTLDWEDEYPENPNQVFNDFYPSPYKYASLVFEALWPMQDDYDFNDMVIDYRINTISDSHNKVAAIEVITEVRAIGGVFNYGFGMQICLSPALIAGIQTDYEFHDDAIQLDDNGCETGQKWATFIFFTDAYLLLTHPGDDSPTINTTMGYHYIVPAEHRLKILFKEPVDPESVGYENLNPFIFSTDERSRETHLKGFPPTDLANPAVFGTADDVTNPGTGIYYQTKNGVPWAFNLPVQFEHTVEQAEILKGYTFLDKWLTSSGAEYADWYMDKPGYRSWDYIYRW